MRQRTLKRVLATFVMTVLTATAGGAASWAQDSDVCTRLQSQLDQYPSRAVASPDLRRFETALREQKLMLDHARAAIADNRCTSGSITVFGSANDPVCDRMQARIRELETEVTLLTAKRDALTIEGRQTGRGRILAALRANGCRPAEQQVVIRDSRRRVTETGLHDLDNPSGRYRTMCVRTCDGYYFPISFSSSPAEFGRDAAQCRQQCPGADVSLFFHSVPDERSEDMVSADGQMPYASLPKAFAYRNGSVPSCSCNPAPRTARRSTEPKKRSSIVFPDEVPIPEKKPEYSSIRTASPVDRNEAKATGEDVSRTKPEKLEPGPGDDGKQFKEMDSDRNVRVVGPTFLPDQSEAIDLQAPDRSDTP